MNYNKVILAGHLTEAPQSRFFDNDKNVCNFTVAVNRKFKKADGTSEEEVCFVDCTAWGKTAEVIGQHMTKGSGIFVEGRLRLDKWQTKEGEKRQRLKVEVERFEFAGSPRGAEQAPDAELPRRVSKPAPAPTDEDPPF